MRSLNLIFQRWITDQFESQKVAYEQFWNCSGTRAGEFILSVWFSLSFVFLKPVIAGIPTWKLPLHLYPHINFAAPRLVDPVKFMIQTLWLVFFKQTPCVLVSKKVTKVFSQVSAWLKKVLSLIHI